MPENYRVYYNGWDRWSILPKTPAVGIHHPFGDAKKISIADGPISIGQWDTGDGEAGAEKAHFVFQYTQGATEGGSSGSSLFSAEHLVVGTLTGGRTEGDDFYGRLKFHWDHFKKNDTIDCMDIYLDPKDGGTAVSYTHLVKNSLHTCLYKGTTAVTIPDGITIVEPYAFLGCSWTASIKFPTSVESVGRASFSETVSYTHLDVYKRQPDASLLVCRKQTHKGWLYDWNQSHVGVGRDSDSTE